MVECPECGCTKWNGFIEHMFDNGYWIICESGGKTPIELDGEYFELCRKTLEAFISICDDCQICVT